MKQQLGKYKKFEYLLNVETGYFEKQPSEIFFQKLPFELKKEVSQSAYLKNKGAAHLMRSRTRKGKKKFHTGLIPLDQPNTYEGNYYEVVKGIKVLSLIIFHFKSTRELTMYFFNRYYIDAPHIRMERCNQFISEKIKGTR